MAPATKLKPLTVEFRDDHCRNFVLQTTRNRVRGRFSHIVLAGREQGPRDTGEMAGMPEIPGQHLTLDFDEYTMELRDPLEDEEHKKTLDRATKVAKKSMLLSRSKSGNVFEAIPPIVSKLDVDKFKTLLLEVGRMLFPVGATKENPQKANIKAVLVNGSKYPTAAQIDELPGEELYDPGSNSSTQPKYKKHSAAWMAELDRRR